MLIQTYQATLCESCARFHNPRTSCEKWEDWINSNQHLPGWCKICGCGHAPYSHGKHIIFDVIEEKMNPIEREMKTMNPICSHCNERHPIQLACEPFIKKMAE